MKLSDNILVYYANVENLIDIEAVAKKQLPQFMLKAAEEFVNETDKKTNLTARLMLQKALSEIGCDCDFNNWKTTTYGKPTLQNQIFFNFSHSQNWVICAISENLDVGVDIEKVKDFNFFEFKNHFSDNEWNIITQAPKPETAFYNFWTKKEAAAKLLGLGLNIPLKELEIIDNIIYINTLNKKIQLFSLSIPQKNIIAHVAVFQTNIEKKIVLKEFLLK